MKNKAKILYVIDGLGISSGGPGHSVFNTVKGLTTLGSNVEILTYDLFDGDSFVSNENFISTIPRPQNRFGYSSEYKKYLKEHTYDIYHTQGMWAYTTLIGCKIARDNKKPYLITPRGMLYPKALEISKMKKRVVYNLLLKKYLNNATCIHCTCEEEANHVRALGIKTPIAIIPNPVKLPTLSSKSDQKPIRVAFIGRLSAIKNIESLIQAWAKIKDNNTQYVLSIIGNGESVDILKNLSLKLNIENIEFLGFLQGAEKENIYDTIKYLVLPSHSENFGMVVAEALSRKIPVIASKGTPWQDLETYQCGWWINNDVDTLAQTLQKALDTPQDEWTKMGENGRKLIEEKYSVEIVSKKLAQLYDWILNNSEKPDFIF